MSTQEPARDERRTSRQCQEQGQGASPWPREGRSEAWEPATRSQATGSPARPARPRAPLPGLTRDSNAPVIHCPDRLFPSMTDPSCGVVGLCGLGTALKLGTNWKRGNNAKYKCPFVTLDWIRRSTHRAKDGCDPLGAQTSLWLQGGKSPVGPDHKFSCRDSHPGPIPMDALCRTPTGPVTH